MNTASPWQVAFVGLVFLILVYAIAQHVKHRAERARSTQAPPDEPHMALALTQLAEARLRRLEEEALAEHHLSRALMLDARIARLAEFVTFSDYAEPKPTKGPDFDFFAPAEKNPLDGS